MANGLVVDADPWFWVYLTFRFFFAMVWFISMVAFVYQYFGHVTEARREPPASAEEIPHEMRLDPRDWSLKPPFFSCFQNADYCLMGCFCSAVRDGDTAHAAGIFPGFWPVFLVHMVLLEIIALLHTQVTTGLAAAYVWLALVALRLYVRISLREKYGGSPRLHVMDCFAVCCCMCCTVVQEARFIDGATSVKYECPWRLLDHKGELMVGPPVEVNEEVNEKKVFEGEAGHTQILPDERLSLQPNTQSISKGMTQDSVHSARFAEGGNVATVMGSRTSVESPKARE